MKAHDWGTPSRFRTAGPMIAASDDGVAAAVERRDSGIVTLLFTDLVGSTHLLERLGDDRAEDVRRRHFSMLREAVNDHRGREVKNLGDGLMVVFSSAVDAVEAAVQMQQTVDRYNHGPAAAVGAELGVRVGLQVGDPIEEDGDYFGISVVIAKRLCDAASGGQILASRLVRTLVGDRAGVAFTPVGDVCCRGVSRPVETFEVAWGLAPRDRLPMPALLSRTTGPSELAPLAGRARELARLQRAWSAVASGGRGIALISGEPGVGKTRLAAALAQAAHDGGSTVLYGRCDEDLLFPGQPFVEALQPVVAGLPAGRLAAGTGGDAGRYRLFELVEQSLITLAGEGPVMVVLDDLHWADPTTLLVLRHLGRHAAPCRLLLVGTYRDVEVDSRHPLSAVLADLRREADVVSVPLAGLSSADVGMVIAHLGGAPLDGAGERLAARLHDLSAGNPMMVREMFRHLVATGAVVVGAAGWHCRTQSCEPEALPEGMQEIIERRLRRLSDAANRILTLASVVGCDFALEVVERVSDSPAAAVLQAVEEGVAANVIAEVSGTFARYRFRHPLVRETLYRRTSRARREHLERRLRAAGEHRIRP